MADISDNIQHAAMSALITGVMTDMAALRAAVLLITAKLAADVGVTDVNYASLCNPAALTTVA